MDDGALIARIGQSDLADCPDWQVSDRLNAPDETLPRITEWRSTSVGISAILEALGAEAGAQFLDALQTQSLVNSTRKWMLESIKGRDLDISSMVCRNEIGQLVADKTLTEEQASCIFAISRIEIAQSWAGLYNIEVTARSVGLARGGR